MLPWHCFSNICIQAAALLSTCCWVSIHCQLCLCHGLALVQHFLASPCCAGGVILALGLIHIAPEAIEDLAQLTEYPVGGVCIVGGVLLCLVLDAMLMALYASSTNSASSGGRPCMHKRAAEARGAGGSSKTDVDVEASAKDAEMALALPQSGLHCHGHNHACLRASSATHQAAVSAMEEASVSGDKQAAAVAAKKIAVAYTMEAGCIFHSVIIGLGECCHTWLSTSCQHALQQQDSSWGPDHC